jgi:hypothetical protein
MYVTKTYFLHNYRIKVNKNKLFGGQNYERTKSKQKNMFSFLEEEVEDPDQGDQIGPIFNYWRLLTLASFF